MNTRVCPDCKCEKTLEEFNSQGKYCKDCHRVRGRRWRKENKDKNRAAQLSYRNKCRNILRSRRKTLVCQKCKQRKPVDSFHWTNREEGVKSFICRDCTSDLRKKTYGKLKGERKVKFVSMSIQRKSNVRFDNTRRILEYLKEHPCIDCGESRPLRLSFDHVRGKKEFTIANHQLLSPSWEKLFAEIQKCDVRCMNCHMEKTAIEQKRTSWKILEGLL